MSTMWLLREVSIDWTINLTGDDHTIKLPDENLRSLMCDCTSSPCWQIIKLSDLNSLPSTPSIFLSMHSQAMIQIIIYCCPTALKCMFLTSIYAPPNHQYLYKPSPKSLSHLYRPPQINTTSLYPPHHFTYTWQSSHVPLFPQSLTHLYLQ